MTQHKGGFSLVELIVVIAIITIIAGIIIASIADARKSSRDKDRVSDLANIAFALTLYREANREYPSYPSGTEVGIGNAIDDVVVQYNGNTYADPKSSGSSGGSYAYWYDSDFTCSEAGQAVIFVRTVEKAANANFSEVCTDSSADTDVAGAESYIVLLKQ